MSGIKYYQLRRDEEPPDEFCVIRDVNGEPEGYLWYGPSMNRFDHDLWHAFKEGEWVDAGGYRRLVEENARLRELLSGVGRLLFALDVDYCACCPRDSDAHPCPVYTIAGGECLYKKDMRELGIEVE